MDTASPSGSVVDFCAHCVYDLTKKDAEKLALCASFSTIEWLQVRAYCMELVVVEWYFENDPVRKAPAVSKKQCYTMATIALKSAKACARSWADWSAIESSVPEGVEKNIARKNKQLYGTCDA